ncbi:uncharacterized protein TNCV_4290231 [Trichonephila clavipes]|nr:uncharacterized protein TNCV_4290231 [Trichonephila clavipes]
MVPVIQSGRGLCNARFTANTSDRHVVEALDLPSSIVQKIMRNILRYYPYKLQLVQELLPHDFETRHLFSLQFLARFEVDPEWPWNILRTDEAHFPVDGLANTHNLPNLENRQSAFHLISSATFTKSNCLVWVFSVIYSWPVFCRGISFSNIRLEKLNTVVKKDTSAIGNYILVDFNQVNNLLRSAKCQYCEKQTLKLELGAKLGFSYNLKLLCSNCDENKTVVNTSLKSVQTSHDVNLRITQAFSHIGKGYSAIEKFCMVMNIDPFSSTTYGKCARRLDNAYTLASENIFAEIHREIKNVYENGAEITDLSVSFDGTWLTRGHTSLIGVGCVIDMLTGYVVDFENE